MRKPSGWGMRGRERGPETTKSRIERTVQAAFNSGVDFMSAKRALDRAFELAKGSNLSDKEVFELVENAALLGGGDPFEITKNLHQGEDIGVGIRQIFDDLWRSHFGEERPREDSEDQ